MSRPWPVGEKKEEDGVEVVSVGSWVYESEAWAENSGPHVLLKSVVNKLMKTLHITY